LVYGADRYVRNQVTVQQAVAHIVVFEGKAVSVRIAKAGSDVIDLFRRQQLAVALTVAANVRPRAGIPIVAGNGVGEEAAKEV